MKIILIVFLVLNCKSFYVKPNDRVLKLNQKDFCFKEIKGYIIKKEKFFLQDRFDIENGGTEEHIKLNESLKLSIQELGYNLNECFENTSKANIIVSNLKYNNRSFLDTFLIRILFTITLSIIPLIERNEIEVEMKVLNTDYHKFRKIKYYSGTGISLLLLLNYFNQEDVEKNIYKELIKSHLIDFETNYNVSR